MKTKPAASTNPVIEDKLAKAFAYLRENRAVSKYCMDVRVTRLPAQSRQPTILDRWLAERQS